MTVHARLLALAGLGLLPFCAQAGFGAEWWLTGKQNEVFIVSGKTTLNVPAAPNPQVDRLVLWPGMLNLSGGLVQSIVASFGDPSQPDPNGCGGQSGQWCAFASYYDGAAQSSGAYVPVNAGDKVDIEYSYNDATQQTTQNVSVNGNVVSNMVTSGGRPYYWDATVECQAQAGGNAPAHSYSNTQIVLNQADPSWGSILTKIGSSDSGLSTPDGGLTWVVGTINIDSYPCTP